NRPSDAGNACRDAARRALAAHVRAHPTGTHRVDEYAATRDVRSRDRDGRERSLTDPVGWMTAPHFGERSHPRTDVHHAPETSLIHPGKELLCHSVRPQTVYVDGLCDDLGRDTQSVSIRLLQDHAGT